MLWSLFYFSPVATVSPEFYLDVHSNWPTFPAGLSYLSYLQSQMKPNVLSHSLRMRPHSFSHNSPATWLVSGAFQPRRLIPQCTGCMLWKMEMGRTLTHGNEGASPPCQAHICNLFTQDHVIAVHNNMLKNPLWDFMAVIKNVCSDFTGIFSTLLRYAVSTALVCYPVHVLSLFSVSFWFISAPFWFSLCRVKFFESVSVACSYEPTCETDGCFLFGFLPMRTVPPNICSFYAQIYTWNNHL